MGFAPYLGETVGNRKGFGVCGMQLGGSREEAVAAG